MEELRVKTIREFGDLISDPFKIIFRNLKEISKMLVFYIFLPFIISMVCFSVFQIKILNITEMEFDGLFIAMTIIALVTMFISYLHAGLCAYSILQVANEDGIENVSYDRVNGLFKSLYLKNLKFVFIISILLGLIFGLMIGTVAISPGLGVVIIFLLMIFLFFYIMPLIIMSWISYLDIDNKLGLEDAISQGRNYVNDYYGSILGIIIVTMIVSGTLQYTFILPLSLINIIFSTSYSMELGSTTYNTYLIIQNGLTAVALAYLIIYTSMVHVMKYYDIRERKYGFSTIEKIKQMGVQKESFFENEGDF